MLHYPWFGRPAGDWGPKASVHLCLLGLVGAVHWPDCCSAVVVAVCKVSCSADMHVAPIAAAADRGTHRLSLPQSGRREAGWQLRSICSLAHFLTCSLFPPSSSETLAPTGGAERECGQGCTVASQNPTAAQREQLRCLQHREGRFTKSKNCKIFCSCLCFV